MPMRMIDRHHAPEMRPAGRHDRPCGRGIRQGGFSLTDLAGIDPLGRFANCGCRPSNLTARYTQ
jgi:hypothetical protein